MFTAIQRIFKKTQSQPQQEPEEIDPNSVRLLGNRSLNDICREILEDAPCLAFRLGTGSNNTWSYKLNVKNRWVKCYETESPSRADLIIRTTALLLNHGVSIPQVQAVKEQVVFADWVEGNSISYLNDRKQLELMADYQREIHTATLDCVQPSDANAIHLEWLLQRLMVHGEQYVGQDRLGQICSLIRELRPGNLQVRVIHPDFIPSNIIVTADGNPVIIDNEFLGIGLGFEFDVMNTICSLFPKDRSLQTEYINRYARDTGCGTLLEHNYFWEICYLVKVAGKSFLSGDNSKGEERFSMLHKKVSEYAR